MTLPRSRRFSRLAGPPVLAWAALLASASAFLPVPALAAPAARSIDVLATVYARSREVSGSLERMPLPYPMAVDSSGRELTGDAAGHLDLTGAAGDVTVYLDSPHFKVRRHETRYSKTVPAAEIARGAEVVFGDGDAPLGARMCRAHLERERMQVLAALPEGAAPAWFDSQVDCEIDYDEGCNAGWDGTILMFHQGDARCEPAANIADMMFHEYGHAVFQHLAGSAAAPGVDGGATGRQPIGQSLDEGVADTMALMMTGDSRFARGFNLGRQLSWIRDVSLTKVYPRDARGTYTASESFSGSWWEIRQAVLASLGAEAGARAALRAYLAGIRAFTPRNGGEQLAQAAEAAIDALAADAETGQIPGISCIARRIFATHGLSPEPQDCVRLALSAAPAPGASPTVTVTVSNAGGIDSPPGELRAGSASAPLPAIPAGQSAVVTLTLEPAAPVACGQPVRETVAAVSETGELLAGTEATAFAGMASEEQEEVVDLMQGLPSSGVRIPDAPTQTQYGPWVRLPIRLSASARARVTRASLELVTDHPFADDLLFAWADARGKTTEFFKGEEEDPVPASIPLPGAERLGAGASFEARDLAHMIEGSIRTARLRVETARFSCPR